MHDISENNTCTETLRCCSRRLVCSTLPTFPFPVRRRLAIILRCENCIWHCGSLMTAQLCPLIGIYALPCGWLATWFYPFSNFNNIRRIISTNIVCDDGETMENVIKISIVHSLRRRFEKRTAWIHQTTRPRRHRLPCGVQFSLAVQILVIIAYTHSAPAGGLRNVCWCTRCMCACKLCANISLPGSGVRGSLAVFASLRIWRKRRKLCTDHPWRPAHPHTHSSVL